jgi:uncharacterized lipoprotein YajG
MPKSVRFLLPLLVVLVASGAWARGAPRPFALKFVPQEGVQTTSLDLEPAFLERAVEIRVEDGRKLADAAVVGQGTDDDDRKFPIRSESDVISYVKETLTAVATDWGLKLAPPADRVLVVSVTRFFVDESNKALGSVYNAEVKLAFALQNRKGDTIDDGIASGDATRYGRSASADNYNEVLSDSLKDAYANLLSDPGLQAAWTSGKGKGTAPPATDEPKLTPEQRLKKLDDLLKKNLITKEEYDKKRAEILAEL